MAQQRDIEDLNRTLPDLRDNKKIMRRLTVLIAGNFLQTLQVIPRSTRADEVKAHVKRSHLWPLVTHLLMNLRIFFLKLGTKVCL